MSDNAPVAPEGSPAAPADAPAKPAAQAAPARPSRVKLALEGDDEREYDLSELRANFAKGKSAAQLMSKADQRAREAIEREKKAESYREALKDRAQRERALKELGIDPRQFAEELLLPYVQAETLNEDQRRALEYQRRNEDLERQAKEREERDRQTKEEEETRAHQERLGQAFVAALDKVGLPRESAPWAIKRMAALAEKAEELGLELPPDEIATLVREDFLAEHRSITSTLTGAQIEALYGEEFIKKVMRHAVAKLKEKKGGAQGQTPAPGLIPTPKPNGAHKPKTTYNEAEWAARMKQLAKEG